jgi:hypothetical protein
VATGVSGADVHFCQGFIGDFVVGEEAVDELDEGVVEFLDGTAQCGGGLVVFRGFFVVGVEGCLGLEDEVGEAGEGGGWDVPLGGGLVWLVFVATVADEAGVADEVDGFCWDSAFGVAHNGFLSWCWLMV